MCTMGVTADRHDFIDNAIENGASAIVVSKDIRDKSVPIIKVEDTNVELPKLCARFYDYPDKKLTMIGITGTKGKSSTAYYIKYILDDYMKEIKTNSNDDIINTLENDKKSEYFDLFIDAIKKYEAALEAGEKEAKENAIIKIKEKLKVCLIILSNLYPTINPTLKLPI